MRGVNYLRLNHETIREAMQLYLDKILMASGSVTVMKVEFTEIKQMQYTNSVNSGNGEFVLTLKGAESPPTP